MYVVSIISERNGKTYFNRCGVGFENKDGSINFKLDVFGDTQFHIRKAQSDAQEPRQDNSTEYDQRNEVKNGNRNTNRR